MPVEEIQDRAGELEEVMDGLLRTAPEGELLREGAVTVLAGRPNSGKSSLFNALIGEERAIVTEVPGTTRDALEAVVSLGGFPFRLVDTAGLRETEERVEKIGVEVARRYLGGADVILFCVEGSRALESEEKGFLAEVQDTPVVFVLRTKVDLATVGSRAGRDRRGVGEVESAGSFRGEGRGWNGFEEALPALVFGGLVGWGATFRSSPGDGIPRGSAGQGGASRPSRQHWPRGSGGGGGDPPSAGGDSVGGTPGGHSAGGDPGQAFETFASGNREGRENGVGRRVY